MKAATHRQERRDNQPRLSEDDPKQYSVHPLSAMLGDQVGEVRVQMHHKVEYTCERMPACKRFLPFHTSYAANCETHKQTCRSTQLQ